MTIAAGTVLLDRFRVVGRRGLSEGAELFDGLETTSAARRVLLVVLGRASSRESPAGIIERIALYREGFPEIVAPIAAGWSDEGRGVVAYPRDDGTTLDEVIARRAPMAPGELARVLPQLGRALSSLHDQGVVHGALRPALIAVGADVRVYGFGVLQLARTLGGSSLASQSVPPAYRAPEYEGGDLGPACDLYALGVIVAELLAGRAAREGSTLTPRGLGALVSDELEAAVAAAICPRSAERPHDVELWTNQLARHLAALQAEPASPRPVEAPASAAPASPEPEPKFEGPNVPTEPAPPALPPVEPSASVGSGKPDASLASHPGNADPFGGALRSDLDGRTSQLPPRSRPSLLVVLALAGGLLLMLGGVVAAAVYLLRKGGSGASAPVTLPPAAPFAFDGGFGGAFGASPGSEDGGPPSASAPLRAPLPAARASTSAEDAKAVLPIDQHVPVWGPPNALVSVVVFGDFECPHTRREYPVLTALKSAFGAELRLAWRNRPIPSHAHARSAALVAAGLHEDLGDRAFWRFAGAALTSRSPATPAELERWAESAGASAVRVGTWLGASSERVWVRADLDLAQRFDVRATPTLFVNGLRVDGYQPYSVLRDLVGRELKAARAARAAGVSAGGVYAARVEHNLLELTASSSPRECPKIADAPTRGASDALVTVVEFGDFECPFCRRAESTLSALMAHHPSELRIAWKDFPLPDHPRAHFDASFAREALARGGIAQFWNVHDALYAADSPLSDRELLRIAEHVGLDGNALLTAAERGAHTARIDGDIEEGKKLGVTGTPTFFVDGRRLNGVVSVSRFETVVGEELVHARRLIREGTPRSEIYRKLCTGS